MALSLRLPAELESQVLSYSARTGMSKSAVIVQSIEAFLRQNAAPTPHDLYEQAMTDAAKTPTLEPAVHERKQGIGQAVRAKHAQRSRVALANAAMRKAA